MVDAHAFGEPHPSGAPPALISLAGIGKTFGRVKALADVHFDIRPGECVGIAGHNGAGKSTLMAVLTGVFQPDEGSITIAGRPVSAYDPNAARDAGVRCVFQELSLCANLSVAENMSILHPELRGHDWRRRATRLMLEQLDAIFPGHGLKGHELIADLTLTKRQMVEIARAFTVVSDPVKLVILDEPTSSLDAHTAAQLLAFVGKAGASGIATILISHMLGEIVRVAHRVLVMRDGRVAAVLPREAIAHDAIVAAMGQELDAGVVQATRRESGRGEALATDAYHWTLGPGGRTRIDAPRGEIIGFAGLAGQGQSEALLAIYEAATNARERVAFVAGDRPRDGIFPLWSIAQNLDIRWLLGGARKRNTSARPFGLIPRVIDRRAAGALTTTWTERIGIRGASSGAGILSLSGGNQQKVLFARALASDAQLILMDDPTRGVDIGTKRELYRLIREEAAHGRTFIWYTTENDEFAHCDRTYVFRAARVTRLLHAHECNEQSLLAASFADVEEIAA
ncbi:ABC transporter ATP-binding protein [Trinickia dabaoshanensis]|uniref:ABC transporter ATP-binding protein n=1 Tax=Trinickia dabaoshanensis TaxID=564714 RepID=A0A2N7VPE6_9BURK|nr:sugar ABC transporter ATP-binding protein [Trinickia dabaoshanensis]PMS19031.1 ABC transporter ATP-binding protein [Trinickia dabaoshanensis]